MLSNTSPKISTARSVEERLHELKRNLVDRNLRFPALPGSTTVPDFGLTAELIGTAPKQFSPLKDGSPSPARTLLNQMIDEQGLMPAEAFRRVLEADRSVAVARHAPDTTMVLLLAWIDNVRSAGIGVPHTLYGNRSPNFILIGRHAGIDPVRLRTDRLAYRGILEAFVGEAGLMDPREFETAMANTDSPVPKAEAQPTRIQKLRRHLHDDHVATGRPLYESFKTPGVPAYGKIIRNAGLTFKGLGAEQALVDVIDAAREIVGVGVDGHRPGYDWKLLTYGKLLTIGEHRAQLEDSGIAEQTLARFLSALRTWIKGIGKIEEDPVSVDFEDRFDANLNFVAETFPNLDTRKRWLANMARWRELVRGLDEKNEGEVPHSFAGALKFLQRRSTYSSIAALARAAGLDEHISTIQNWATGATEPVNKGWLPILHRLEAQLGVERGTLTGRVRQYFHLSKKSTRDEHWPPSLDKEHIRKFARPFLPYNFHHLPLEEREAIGRSIRSEWESNIKFRRDRKGQKRWRLPALPDRVERIWRRIVEYKTDAFPEFDRQGGWFGRGTVDRNFNVIHEFFSVMALPESAGGGGVPEDKLTFALLACPRLVRRYFRWHLKRGEGALNTGSLVWAGVLGNLATPNTKNRSRQSTNVPGFLHFVPELASELEPIDNVVTEAEIAKLRTPEGWAEGLTSFNKELWDTWIPHKNKLKKSRDPFAPIRGILDLPEPMAALYDMLDAAAKDLPDPRRVTPRERAFAVRRFVSAALTVESALRRWNISSLTYLPNNTGQFRKVGDHWQIQLEVDQFKNRDSSFFGVQQRLGRSGGAYVNGLPAEYTPIFDEYVTTSRQVLLKGKDSDALLINASGNPIGHECVSVDFEDYTWKYLVFHELTGTGIKGVERFRPHAVRHIVATDILKNTGDAQFAADAIQDTVATVLSTYAFVLTEHRVQRVNEFRAARKSNRAASLAA